MSNIDDAPAHAIAMAETSGFRRRPGMPSIILLSPQLEKRDNESAA
jgi:hypothetical protein